MPTTTRKPRTPEVPPERDLVTVDLIRKILTALLDGDDIAVRMEISALGDTLRQGRHRLPSRLRLAQIMVEIATPNL